MADDLQEEEWLYGGDSVPKPEPVIPQPTQDNDTPEVPDGENSEDAGNNVEGDGEPKGVAAESVVPGQEGGQGGSDEGGEPANDVDDDDDDEDEDSDDDDDGVQVVIGDIKAVAAPAQATFGAKRIAGPPPDKKGKFSTDDFEGVGMINGVPAQDFSLDSIEEKPWRKPGADLTDYFNYGFTEETWRAYCDRQKRLRYESGNTMPVIERERKHHPQGGPHMTSIPIVGSDHSKYGGPPNVIFPKKFGMQDRPQKDMQRISRQRDEIRENTIQVMTADRREYSRKTAFDMPPIPPPFDMSVPPPSFPPPDPYGGPPDFFNHPPPAAGYYPEDHNLDYEEQQWMDSAWDANNMQGPGPSGATTVVPLTKVPNLPPPPGEGDDLGQRTPPTKEEK